MFETIFATWWTFLWKRRFEMLSEHIELISSLCLDKYPIKSRELFRFNDWRYRFLRSILIRARSANSSRRDVREKEKNWSADGREATIKRGGSIFSNFLFPRLFLSFFLRLLASRPRSFFPFIGFSRNKLVTNKSIDSPKEKSTRSRGPAIDWNQFTQSEVIKMLLTRNERDFSLPTLFSLYLFFFCCYLLSLSASAFH